MAQDDIGFAIFGCPKDRPSMPRLDPGRSVP